MGVYIIQQDKGLMSLLQHQQQL